MLVQTIRGLCCLITTVRPAEGYRGSCKGILVRIIIARCALVGVAATVNLSAFATKCIAEDVKRIRVIGSVLSGIATIE